MRAWWRVAGAPSAWVVLAWLLAVGSPAPRIVRGPYLQPSAPGQATVVWYTDVASEGMLEWAEENGGWTPVREPGAPKTRHEVTFGGLREGVPYAYRILGAGSVLADVAARAEFGFDAPANATLRAVAFGDCGTGGASQMAVARAIFARGPLPEMVLLTGDIVYPNGADKDYDPKFFAPYGPLLSRVPFYAAMGNHDYETLQGAAYLDIFSLPLNGPPELIPETVYSFERAGVHFVVHDSNLVSSKLKQVVVPWHAADLRASRARFRIAMLHHAPYSSGTNSVRHPTTMLRDIMGPLFSNTGVDLVLAGHDHLYERTKPIGGVVYVTSGAGGAGLYPRVSTNDFTEVFYGEGGRHSYTSLEVTGRILALRQTDIAGCNVDNLGLDKPVAEGDAWRIWKGTTAPPPEWTSRDFDDRTWGAFPAGLGYGSTDFLTGLPDMKGGYVTLYARNTFLTATAGNVDHLMLRIRYDDGFIAYLNGVEVARRNVADGQGPRTPAASAHSGESFETIHLPAALLRLGTNVLAIEGHNRTISDDSFLLAPELTLLAAEPGRCP